MALRFEWRSRSEGDDTILAVEEGTNTVVKAWRADPDLLADFLNDMAGLDAQPTNVDAKPGNGMDEAHRSPQEWGELAMARSDAGDVLNVNPQLYWEGIAHWFRSQGRDPHPYHARG
jgi:hypothetical protein